MRATKSKIDNDGMHIQGIIDKTPCPKHGAAKGMPCYEVYYNTRPEIGLAVCNLRVITAGFNGDISSEALSIKSRPRFKKF